jgi:hypothetical protein
MLNARKTFIAAALIAVAPTLAFAATSDAKPATAPMKAEHVIKKAHVSKTAMTSKAKHHAKLQPTKIKSTMAKKPAVVAPKKS